MEKRLFIAIKYEPDEEFKHSYLAIQKNVGSLATIKWVPTHQLHLTLCFLGNTHVSLLETIGNAIDEVCAQNHSFEVQIGNLGIFSHQRQPRVLWMGLQPVKVLQHLHLQLAERLVQDFKSLKNSNKTPLVEVNPNFVPHLTLGRFKNTYKIADLQAYLASHAHTQFGNWNVSQVILYESILSRLGPTYQPLRMANLSN
ncbi:MAG TPA: RNA 2',3'-cyclic phosphodiesterase [Bacteroidales bacterium]|nr:RNA 2',3'-cyclic phosphodiesterase [Bacteroidales bacterium]HOK98607.1 RNA 2',3'-cyclic phosphodiesterase [Bacteroidales bacterium]HPO65459.1 RNA 2',3'-cyclic phosphodiesterase [Bacteroidales bacterium]